MDLQDIARFQDENIGGTTMLLYADPEAITDLPFPDADNLITGTATFSSGRWYLAWHTTDTGRLQEGSSEGPGGTVYDHTFTALIPADSTTTRPLVEEIQRRQCLLDVRDGNGLWRRLGTLRNRPRWQFTYDSGGSTGERAGWRLTVSWRSERPAPFVNDPEDSGS